jgi:DNA gyrase subunit A
LRDESDKDGMRIYIEVKRGDSAEVVLNNLYAQTPMESVFGINMVALVDGRPQLLNLKQILEAFVRHRREVVTRRTIFELRKARARAHILEGLTVALANIDEMIELIKTSANPNEARERMLAKTWEPGLVASLLAAAGSDASRPEDLPLGVGLNAQGRYQLTETQAKEILEMRLHRLTGLEQDKLTDEYKALLDTIRGLIEILENPDRLREVIRDELLEIKQEYGDDRRSEIRASEEDLDILDLIAPEDVVVTLSHSGYAKRQPVTAYRAQRRGGRGRNAAATKDEDFIDQLWLVNTHDTLLTFTSSGRVFWLPVHQLPDAGPNARGRPVINWLALEEGEKVQAVVPVRAYEEGKFVFFATRNGTVKKTPLTEFAFRLARGKIAINLDDGDALVGVGLTDGSRDIMLFASNGRAVRFSETLVRAMGRTATGVRGMRLVAPTDADGDDGAIENDGETADAATEAPNDSGSEVVSLVVVDGDGDILTASERGYGKRTPVDDYPRKGRGTKGVIALKTTERNGRLVGAVQLSDHHEVLLISDGGTLVRTRASEISQVGRNTQGVTLMRLGEGESLQALERLDASLDEDTAEPTLDPAPPARDYDTTQPMPPADPPAEPV